MSDFIPNIYMYAALFCFDKADSSHYYMPGGGVGRESLVNNRSIQRGCPTYVPVPPHTYKWFSSTEASNENIVRRALTKKSSHYNGFGPPLARASWVNDLIGGFNIKENDHTANKIEYILPPGSIVRSRLAPQIPAGTLDAVLLRTAMIAPRTLPPPIDP